MIPLTHACHILFIDYFKSQILHHVTMFKNEDSLSGLRHVLTFGYDTEWYRDHEI